jgi:hypothetical protein
MKAPRNASKASAAAPKKGEARTGGTVSGLKITHSSKQRQHIKSGQPGKMQDSRSKVIAESIGRRIGLTEYITPVEKIKALQAIRDFAPGNTGAAQESRILEALSHWSLTTFEASRYLDSYDPRARVMSLRGKGHAIVTSWTLVRTECGRLHRVGIYTLQRGRVLATQHQPQHEPPAGAAVAAPHDQEAQA